MEISERFSSLQSKLNIAHIPTVHMIIETHPNRMVRNHPAFKTSFIEIFGGCLSSHKQQQPYCHKAQHTASVLCHMRTATQVNLLKLLKQQYKLV